MKGCSRTAPDCLHSLRDCLSLIHKIGFLPLFSNEIPGFSVEEHVPAEYWWCDDASVDPWLWRMLLAKDPSIAYGKFFNRTAGFVSRDWFPTFANYRRNGYDFDALFEDELASYRCGFRREPDRNNGVTVMFREMRRFKQQISEEECVRILKFVNVL